MSMLYYIGGRIKKQNGKRYVHFVLLFFGIFAFFEWKGGGWKSKRMFIFFFFCNEDCDLLFIISIN